MITREQVANLQPGDVVELKFLHEYDASTITARGTFPAVVDWFENHEGGKYTLTVVSRAVRPLYVNSGRTEPVAGDVVRDADDENSKRTWCHDNDGRFCWWGMDGGEATFNSRAELPDRLRLLVDGETGQVVQ